MPSGFGLNGAPSSTEASFIVPFVGNATKYYIFTTDFGGLNYSVVDMNANGGLGDVVSKNTNLSPSTLEKIAVLRHSNCTDYWVIDHGVNNNMMRAWLVSAAGVSNVPVISNVGITPAPWGHLKGSNKSKKLVLTSYNGSTNNAEIYDFNNTTGVISNPQTISNNMFMPYSCAFSPNDSLFYIGYIGGINQYQTYAAAIPATENKIASTQGLAVISLGPDCKIYADMMYGATSLGCINNPNSKTNPNYVNNAVFLGGKACTNGLPIFIGRDRTFKAEFGIVKNGCSLTIACKDSSLTFNCSAGPTKWLWNFGDNTTSTLQNPSHTYAGGGTYTIKLVVSNGCTSDSITKPVNIGSGVTATVTSSNVKCFGDATGTATAIVSGGTGPFAYNWNSNPVQTGTTAVNLTAGIYAFSVTDSKGCTATVTTQITQPTALALAVNPSTLTTCVNQNVSMTALCTGGTPSYTYSWSNGPSTSNYNVTQTSAGTFNYSITVTDNNGCVIGTSVMLVFRDIPVVAVTSASVCEGQIAKVTASGADSFVWTPGNVTGNTYTINGTTNVVLTVVGTSDGCVSSATTAITVNSLPKPVITSGGNKGCAPVCMNFTCSSTNQIQTYDWNFGDGSSASTPIAGRCFTMPGEYTVSVNVIDNNGCAASVTYSLEAYPTPVADFNYAPIKPLVNEDVNFTDASHNATIAKWDWYFIDKAKPHSNAQNPTYIYTEAGEYPVALVVTSDHGCTDTIVKTILVGEDYGIFVPNSFTPNNDGLNDIFQPKGFGITKYELRIFNRWGEELLFTNDFAQGWDGTFKGKLAEEDTYTWAINLTNVFGKAHELTGSVTVMK